ncbi:LLM class flavin-dependent oxidoreductase [Micromonospora cathayae]|uniref:LLM class flavin-dependent oxidoreductase n=1 Tax=Micromonospora cathayae TaxID=3028804 RepID=A0ABY7ZPK0_9ACTN|nr:LLM class flavin-dependent oxidoreductase [Micromonospora sp. HUAS 3]WDZ83799.1 LLM class flavin-dependent oxidoreductase [Micromonospora sp. HUAS 3]
MKISFVTSAFGTVDGQRRFDMPSFVTECQAAEQAGFYAAYTGERRGRGPASGQTAVTFNPDLLCMYGLAHTSSLVFGTHITLLPLHHPVRVAQDATLVNAMFPGRYRLGLGAGYTTDDFRAFGVDLSERGRRMTEGLKAINAYREGRNHELAGGWQGVVPDRDPALGDDPLEIYLGAWSRPGVRRAARYGDGWYTGPIRTVAAEAELAQVYRDECAKVGKEPKVILMREAGLGVTDADARAVHGDLLLEYARIYWSRGGTYDPQWDPWVGRVEKAEDITLDMVMPDRFLCGSIDTWLDTIAGWKETIQPDEIILRLRYFYGPSLETAIREMDLIGKHVIPALA